MNTTDTTTTRAYTYRSDDCAHDSDQTCPSCVTETYTVDVEPEAETQTEPTMVRDHSVTLTVRTSAPEHIREALNGITSESVALPLDTTNADLVKAIKRLTKTTVRQALDTAGIPDAVGTGGRTIYIKGASGAWVEIGTANLNVSATREALDDVAPCNCTNPYCQV